MHWMMRFEPQADIVIFSIGYVRRSTTEAKDLHRLRDLRDSVGLVCGEEVVQKVGPCERWMMKASYVARI